MIDEAEEYARKSNYVIEYIVKDAAKLTKLGDFGIFFSLLMFELFDSLKILYVHFIY
jgi:hypothetical protein